MADLTRNEKIALTMCGNRDKERGEGAGHANKGMQFEILRCNGSIAGIWRSFRDARREFRQEGGHVERLGEEGARGARVTYLKHVLWFLAAAPAQPQRLGGPGARALPAAAAWRFNFSREALTSPCHRTKNMARCTRANIHPSRSPLRPPRAAMRRVASRCVASFASRRHALRPCVLQEIRRRTLVYLRLETGLREDTGDILASRASRGLLKNEKSHNRYSRNVREQKIAGKRKIAAMQRTKERRCPTAINSSHSENELARSAEDFSWANDGGRRGASFSYLTREPGRKARARTGCNARGLNVETPAENSRYALLTRESSPVQEIKRVAHTHGRTEPTRDAVAKRCDLFENRSRLKSSTLRHACNIATEFCVRVGAANEARRLTEAAEYNLAEEEVTSPSHPRRAASRAARVRALGWGCWPSWTVRSQRERERDGESARRGEEGVDGGGRAAHSSRPRRQLPTDLSSGTCRSGAMSFCTFLLSAESSASPRGQKVPQDRRAAPRRAGGRSTGALLLHPLVNRDRLARHCALVGRCDPGVLPL
ncbi:hypothetical protein DBV15_03553 [Temnothorax longispinosus]|uniref:Uncharacterized protein n=1 Tax=Temnothorax longispinosus TaxID=300112 RepID=A0A4S2KWB2_9HYME|nr:hypothetical protein DBV15_03553 [Temnothorax longispinosus]